MDTNYFEILGKVTEEQVIASGHRLRDLDRLQKTYGLGKWAKRKGSAFVRLHPGGEVIRAEVHWYEAHGIGKKEFKIKRILE